MNAGLERKQVKWSGLDVCLFSIYWCVCVHTCWDRKGAGGVKCILNYRVLLKNGFVKLDFSIFLLTKIRDLKPII